MTKILLIHATIIFLIFAYVKASTLTATINTNNKMRISNNFGTANSARDYSIRGTFLGFSSEHWSVYNFFDLNAKQPRAWFRTLLAYAKRFSASYIRFRIGGNSSDESWTGTLPQPFADSRYRIPQSYFEAWKSLAQSINAKIVFGLNFVKTTTEYAVEEVRAIENYIGWNLIEHLEIGNEPEKYCATGYRTCPAYNFNQYKVEQTKYITEIRAAFPTMPPNIFQGPQFYQNWFTYTDDLITSMSPTSYRSFSFDIYGTDCCGAQPPLNVLLQDTTIASGKSEIVKSISRKSDQFNKDWYFCETNHCACQGYFGFSDTYAAALWMVDWLFTVASMGVTGVNIHGTGYSPKSPIMYLNGGQGFQVTPQYYSILLFDYSVRSGAQILEIAPVASDINVKAWAVTNNDDQTLRIVLINKTPNACQSTITIANQNEYNRFGTVAVMRGQSAAETSIVSFAGQTFRGSANGEPIGAFTTTDIQWQASTLAYNLEAYTVAVISVSKGTPGPPAYTCQNDCNGHGTCTAQDVCACVAGYNPATYCSTCKLHYNPASGCTTCTGNWNIATQCTSCLNGWTGADCGTRTQEPSTCDPPPLSYCTNCGAAPCCNGICYSTEVHVCTSANRLCPKSAPRSCGTACYNSQIYHCLNGNLVAGAETCGNTPVYTCQNNCNGHGTCTAQDVCTCTAGYNPTTFCATCKLHYNPASGCTTCTGNWNIATQCTTCLNGWTGADCNTPQTNPTDPACANVRCQVNYQCCAGACYSPQIHTCTNGRLCPSGTLPCGAACYSPTAYSCCNGNLAPVGSC